MNNNTKPTIGTTTTEKKVKEARFRAFLMNDKDPYICYRFVMRLEELMPPSLSQLKPIAISEDATAEEWMGKIVIPLEPKDVYARYLDPFYEPPYVFMGRDGVEKFDEIKKIAMQYCRYLKSTQLDRLRYYSEERKEWEVFV